MLYNCKNGSAIDSGTAQQAQAMMSTAAPGSTLICSVSILAGSRKVTNAQVTHVRDWKGFSRDEGGAAATAEPWKARP